MDDEMNLRLRHLLTVKLSPAAWVSGKTLQTYADLIERFGAVGGPKPADFAKLLQVLEAMDYLTGLMETFFFMRTTYQIDDYKFPARMDVMQLATAVRGYLAKFPERIDASAAELCYLAVVEAFPPSASA